MHLRMHECTASIGRADTGSYAPWQVQQRVKLCVKRDLTEHDIVSRIMRKENYLIGA